MSFINTGQIALFMDKCGTDIKQVTLQMFWFSVSREIKVVWFLECRIYEIVSSRNAFLRLLLGAGIAQLV
jgi:hypothetical protein